MSEIGILVIQTDKETGEYKRFEIYPKKFESELPQKAEEWNKNDKNETICKIYNDPLLTEMACDLQSSWSRENLISSLKSIAKDIEDSVENLESWNEQIESELNDNRYKDALQNIRDIAENCLVSTKISPEDIQKIINECNEALNE